MKTKEYLNIANEKFRRIPATFKFLFLVRFDKKVAEKIKTKKYGVKVDLYGTQMYPVSGHYKNISKIIDYNLIQKKNDPGL